MKSIPRKRPFVTLALVAAAIMVLARATVAASPADGQASQPAPMNHGAGASMMDHGMPCHEQMQGMNRDAMASCMMQRHGQGMAHMKGMMPQGDAPGLPGQDAFGAIQEIVRMLESDPATDWSKIDLEALRQHLIDMNEVALKADAVAQPIDGGLAIAVTGSGRTLVAIQRLVPTHAKVIDGLNGWSAKTDTLPNGVRLTVTASDPREVRHIRGLGFVGILVTGSHHQPHHLAMAKGEFARASGAHAQHLH
jgi:hypothetical protein